jgi:hypothetical protein
MKRISMFTIMALAATGSVAFAQSGFQAKPGVYDPDKTGTVSAAWVNGIGLPDAVGNSSFGMLLQKNTVTSTNAAAGASITGVNGITLTEAGYDIKDGSHCSLGAPRFDVSATDGFHFLGGCAHGTQSPSPAGAGWTRVRFNPNDPTQCYPPIAPGATILAMSLILDEGTDQGTGSAIVDNIDINGTLIMKPGTSK